MWLTSGLQRLKALFAGPQLVASVPGRDPAPWPDGWTADWVPDRPRHRPGAERQADAPNPARPSVHVMEGSSRDLASRKAARALEARAGNWENSTKQGRSDMNIQDHGSLAAESGMNGSSAHGMFAAPLVGEDDIQALPDIASEGVRDRRSDSNRTERANGVAASVNPARPSANMSLSASSDEPLNAVPRAGKAAAGLGGGGTGGGGGVGSGDGDGDDIGDDPPAPPPAGNTSALNQQVVQAVQFSNTENLAYGMKMAVTPPEVMVGQTTGQAVQDAASYMNAIMQIAVAAQAIAIKKAAQGPVGEAEAVPLLAEIQSMVTAAVQVYGSVSTTAGQSAQTIFNDLKTP